MTNTHEREHHDLVVELLNLDPLSAEAVAKRNEIAVFEQRDPTLIKQRLEIMAAYARPIGALPTAEREPAGVILT